MELSLYFLAHGEVRHRKPETNAFRITTIPPKKGSFEFLCELVANPDNFVAFGVGLTTNTVYDWIKFTYNKAFGITDEPQSVRIEPFFEKSQRMLKR